jgi:hypothetical protein
LDLFDHASGGEVLADALGTGRSQLSTAFGIGQHI